MNILIPNSFSTYHMTEEDALNGSIFTPLQMEVLHNILAIYAEEKLTIDYDVKNPESFIQEEAYKRGQIEVLKYLLENSKACQELLDNPPEL